MLPTKKELPTYPDGVLGIYKAKPRATDFNARRNVTGRKDLEFVGSVCFNTQSIREQDYEFAARESFKLSLKVKCQRFDLVTSEHLALVGDTLFDVSHIDKTPKEMFLYLEEVRKIDSE